MHRLAAISKDFWATLLAFKLDDFKKAIAAACANPPPDPIDTIGPSGSITLPSPDIIKLNFL